MVLNVLRLLDALIAQITVPAQVILLKSCYWKATDFTPLLRIQEKFTRSIRFDSNCCRPREFQHFYLAPCNVSVFWPQRLRIMWSVDDVPSSGQTCSFARNL